MPTDAQVRAERKRLDDSWRDAHKRLAEVQNEAKHPSLSYLETAKLLDHSRGLQKQIARLRRQFEKAGFEPPSKVG